MSDTYQHSKCHVIVVVLEHIQHEYNSHFKVFVLHRVSHKLNCASLYIWYQYLYILKCYISKYRFWISNYFQTFDLDAKVLKCLFKASDVDDICRISPARLHRHGHANNWQNMKSTYKIDIWHIKKIRGYTNMNSRAWNIMHQYDTDLDRSVCTS